MSYKYKDKSYASQLQGCNCIHILMGLLSLALAGSQFSDLGLENYHQIDFRLVNWIHLITGAVGFHVVSKNYGSIAAKVLYCASAVIGIFTVAFYCDTLIQVVQRYKETKEYSEKPGGDEDGYSQQVKYHVGRIAVCGVMIGVGSLEAFVGYMSERYLRRLSSDLHSNLRRRDLKNRGRMAFVAFMKLFFGILTIGLGAGLEHLYKKKDGTFKYIKIGWEICAGAFSIGSSILDLYALYSDKHNFLNLKVSLVFSVATSVLSLKTVDYMMSGFFLEDVRDYTTFDDKQGIGRSDDSFATLIRGPTTPSSTIAEVEEKKQELFLKFGIHAGCIASLIIIFFHCVISAVEAGSIMERVNSSREGLDLAHHPGGGMIASVVDSNLHQQRNCLGVFQFLWGVILVVLSIISLVPWEFSQGYSNGPGILWVGLLFMTAGSVTAGRIRTLSTSVYVTGVISSVVSLEYLLFTINELIQAVINPKFDTDTETVRTGRIVLFSIQLGVLLAQFLTATAASNTLEKVIRSLPMPGQSVKKDSFVQSTVAFIHFLYAIVTIGVNAVNEVVIWRHNDVNVSVQINPFVRITNGPIIFVTAIVQAIAAQRPQFLVSAAILQTISAGIALFVLAPAISNLHYLYAIYQATYDSSFVNFNDLSASYKQEKLVMEIAMGLTGAVILVALLEYTAAVISAMHSSFLTHNFFTYYIGGDGRFSTVTSRFLLNGKNHHGGSGGSRDSRIENRSIVDANGSILTNGARKYFGNDFRTYGENRMYSPSGMEVRTAGQNGGYGYMYHNNIYGTSGAGGAIDTAHHGGAPVHAGLQPPVPRMRDERGSQTNIRHVFQNGYDYR